MKASFTLNWASLLSKIHSPLPISSRESQRLLALLNASLKQRLDLEYPSGFPNNEHHTDLHLHSILTNPLFAYRPRQRRHSSPGGRPRAEGSLVNVQDLMKRPMDIFRERVSSGTATLEFARFCLDVQYKSCLASSSISPKDAMRSTEAGAAIADWLWASGLEDSGSFLDDPQFTNLLIRFLIAERRYDRILRWLKMDRPVSTEAPKSRSREKWPGVLLQMIRAEVQYGDGIESATMLFVDILSQSQRKSIDVALRILFGPAGNYLTSTLTDVSGTADISASAIKAFLTSSRAWINPLLSAWQCAYLGKNHTPAWNLIRKVSPECVQSMRPQTRLRFVRLSLRTSELLLEKGRKNDVAWIMNFLKDNFREEIGSYIPPTQVEGSSGIVDEREEVSLRSLEALAVH